MFEKIVGHIPQKKLLNHDIQTNNISHAYLFSGKKGIGKASMAFEFAKEILNVKNLESSADFKYICKKEDKKDILIEQVRKEIIDDIYIVPSSGNKKVYIIDDAQLLNIAAQNALLKTLEEPPKYVVLILISSNSNSFLSTIISRVNKIDFDGILQEELNKYLIEEKGETLDINILGFLDGSIGLANYLIENNRIEEIKKIDELYISLEKKDTFSVFKIGQNIEFLGEYILDYLEYILYIKGKYTCVKYIEKSKLRLKYNGNYDIVIDNMLLKVIEHI